METRLLPADQIDRQAWEELLATSPQGNFFALPAYMDIIAPGWQGIELREGPKLLAVMPINLRKKAGFTATLQPPFAQNWGIYFAATPPTTNYKHYSRTRKLVVAALDALPQPLHLFAHTFAPEFDYPLPFHWKGYSLTTRYTYRLPLDAPREQLLADMDKGTQKLIKSAADMGIFVEPIQVSELLQLATANKQVGKDLLGGQGTDTLHRIAHLLLEQNRGFILGARQEGKLLAAGLFGQHAHKTTYLVGAQSPDVRGGGAQALVVWQAISRSQGPGQLFDFEGSMIEGIEGFFRGFGAVPVPFLFIQKNGLPLWVRWIRKSR